MNKNVLKSVLFFIVLCIPVIFSNAQAGLTRATIGEDARDFWNLGIGYDAKGNNYTSYALDMKKISAVSDTQSNGNKLSYSIIDNKYNLSDTSFLGVDLGLDVKVPFVEVKASTSMEIYNSITTSLHCVSMIVSYEYIKESLDVINAELSDAAKTYYLANGKNAFVARYGDRYLDKVDVGGRLNFVYRLSVSDTSRIDKSKLKIACNVLVGEVFKGDVNVTHTGITDEELSQITKEVFVFYNGLPWRAEVKDYNDYCDLRDKFLAWLSSNTVAVNKRYVKYNELEFTDNVYYATLNEWYRLREIVLTAKNKAQGENNWEMEAKCNDAQFKINNVISSMKPDSTDLKPPALMEYKEILDYANDESNQLANSKAIPVGTVVSFMGDSLNVPIGYLLCDGSVLDKTVYGDLYSVIGDAYAQANTAPAEKFNLPDLRGQFLRGLDTSGTVDPDGLNRKLGSTQADAFQGHRHNFTNGPVPGSGHLHYTTTAICCGYNNYVGGGWTDIGDPSSSSINNSVRTSTETRPKNVAVNFIIKY